MDEKQTLWQKTKAFLKKYWIVISIGITGVITGVWHFVGLFRRSRNRNANFRDELDQLGNRLGNTETGLSELADNNEQARELNAEQREEITDIRIRHTDIEDTSAEIGNSLQRIKQLIKAERERIENTEDKD